MMYNEQVHSQSLGQIRCGYHLSAARQKDIPQNIGHHAMRILEIAFHVLGAIHTFICKTHIHM